MARVFMDSRSAALAAKHRQRGPSVLERLRADEEAAAQAAAVASERWAKRRKTAPLVQPPPECTGGMAMKTGMVLARAQLAESTSGVVAARDRQAALVGKGLYRQAEKVAQEQPVGTLATKDMPKRKGSALDKGRRSSRRPSQSGCARACTPRCARVRACTPSHAQSSRPPSCAARIGEASAYLGRV